MNDGLRKSGIDIIGDVSWGTHFCQFYQTRDDLIDTLVPYFKAGLENNEFCMWVTAHPLTEREAEEAMRQAVPDFAHYLRRGQIEIIPHTEWYLKDGVFDSRRVLNGWIEKLEEALKRGYGGLRLTGNTFWLEESGWKSFLLYEDEINNVIGKYPMMAICTYSLSRCGAGEILDVVNTHQFALARREGTWDLFESTGRKRAEEALGVSEARYRRLFEHMGEGFAYCKMFFENGQAQDFLYLSVNHAFETLTGLKDVTGKRVSEVIPGIRESDPGLFDVYGRVALGGPPEKFEAFVAAIQQWLSISVYCPEPGHFIAVFDDITKRKRTEEALRASLADKDILMRELAHRTKNNMQVIGSLLGLQAAASADEKFADALADTQDRIRAMALVHEKLYRSGNVSSLNMRDYVKDLLTSLLRAHQGTVGPVTPDLDLEDMSLSLDAALPCGLIINELVSNSLKHAFPGRKPGAIFLSLRQNGTRAELTYRDDGPGLPRDLDLSRSKSLGLKLVYNLAVRQLRGTMEVRRDPVTEFVFSFEGSDGKDSV